MAARSRLNPAAGVMLSAVWAASTGQLALIIHHLAVDGVSWRILLEDLNIAWAQHHSGQPVALPAGGTSFARWASLLAEHAASPAVVDQAEAWRQVAATPAVLPAVQPGEDTYVSAGQLSVSLDVETTRMLLGEVPGGVSCRGARHPVDRVRVGVGAVCWAPVARRSASMWRATGARRSWARQCGLVAHGGLVYHQVPGGVERSVGWTGRR